MHFFNVIRYNKTLQEKNFLVLAAARDSPWGMKGGREDGGVDCKNTGKIVFICHLLFHYYDALLLFGLYVP